MTIYLFSLLLLLNSYQAQADWHSIETIKFDWAKTNHLYTLTLEKRQDDESRLRIETPDHPDFVLPIANGVVRPKNEIGDQKLIADNRVQSSYFYLTPKLRDQFGRPMLLIFGEAIASDPGGLHVVALIKAALETFVFSKAFRQKVGKRGFAWLCVANAITVGGALASLA